MQIIYYGLFAGMMICLVKALYHSISILHEIKPNMRKWTQLVPWALLFAPALVTDKGKHHQRSGARAILFALLLAILFAVTASHR